MLTRPTGLTDDRVAEVLERDWFGSVEAISHAPVGFGSHHWHVTADGSRWFATVDDLVESHLGPDPRTRLIAALTTARRLAESKLEFVVAPVPARTGRVVADIDDRYVIAVYPHVEGESFGWGAIADGALRSAVLDRLVALHGCRPGSGAFDDSLDLPHRRELAGALADLARPWGTGPFADRVRHLLGANADALVQDLSTFDELAVGVSAEPARRVVTHGEPHRGNIISTADGVMLIDWDTLLVAPPERDLWWLTSEDDAIVDEYERRSRITVDVRALEFYRRRWRLADIASFVAQFRQEHEVTADVLTSWNALVASMQS